MERRLTRNELRILAEELYGLMRRDLPSIMAGVVARENDEYLNMCEAAEFLGVSVGFMKDHMKEIPHTKVGRLNKFRKSSLAEYRSRS